MNALNAEDLKLFLEEKVLQYNHPDFLRDDPIQVPHQFSLKEDIEISGFLTATIAWGNRKSIIRNANSMVALMDGQPYDFVINHQESDLKRLDQFVHRTFNGEDFKCFIKGLQYVYLEKEGLEGHFARHSSTQSMQYAISRLKADFFSVPHSKRTRKHLADPMTGSAAKRLNMFLRWMVRDASTGVDFGLWKSVSTAKLSCPLDVHSGNVARKLGLLERRQNDAKSVEELDKRLRLMDPLDPAKYDFALFGLGVFEKF